MNKKIAICISGHLRKFKGALPNFIEFLHKPLRRLGEIDIFLCTSKTVSSNTGWQGSIGNKQDESEIDVDEAIKIYGATAQIIDDKLVESQFKTSNFVNPLPDIVDIRRHSGAMLRYIPMFAKIYWCNELKKKKESDENFIYDLVIRTRPDLLYPYPLDIDRISNSCLINKIFIGKPAYFINNAKFKYENGGQIRDCFALGTSENMDKYSSVYENLPYLLKYKYSEVAENLLHNHLMNLNIETEGVYEDIGILR